MKKKKHNTCTYARVSESERIPRFLWTISGTRPPAADKREEERLSLVASRIIHTLDSSESLFISLHSFFSSSFFLIILCKRIYRFLSWRRSRVLCMRVSKGVISARIHYCYIRPEERNLANERRIIVTEARIVCVCVSLFGKLYTPIHTHACYINTRSGRKRW